MASIVGAVMFCFSGSLTRQYVHYYAFILILTTPLLFWLSESLARKFRLSSALAMSLVIGNNFFLCHIQYASYQIPITGIYYGIRVLQIHGIKNGFKLCLYFIGIVALAGLLGAPFFLPFQDQIAGSVTSHGRGGSYSIIEGERWFRLILLFHSLFAPMSVGSDAAHANIPSLAGHSWAWSIYLGVIPWFCAASLWNLRKRPEIFPLLITAFLALLFFVPDLYVPLFPDFRKVYSLIPVWNLFHNYERFLFLGVFCMSVMLTLSLDSWAHNSGRFAMVIPFLLLVAWGSVSVCASLFDYPQLASSLLPEKIYTFLKVFSHYSGNRYIMHLKFGSAVSVFLLLAFAATGLRAWFKLPSSAFLWLVLVLLFADLMCYAIPFKPTLNVRRFLSPSGLVQLIPKGARYINVNSSKNPSWIWNRNRTPFESKRCLEVNMNLFFGLSGAGGYSMPVFSNEDYDVFNMMLAEIPVQKNFRGRDFSDHDRFAKALSLWRLFSIEYMITDSEINLPGLSLAGKDGEYRLYRITESFPRFFCSSDIIAVKEWNEVKEQLENYNVELAQCIIPDQAWKEHGDLGGGIITSISGKKMNHTLEVNARKGGTFLIQTDRWTKEWQAEIDGKPAELHKVNGMQRGVFVPAGSHTVCFRYYDRHLKTGMWLAGFALLTIAAFCIWLFIQWLLKRRPTGSGLQTSG